MNAPVRRTSNGQSLISQGEPMIWLSGGTFAIACLMILSLLLFLLYQGLATHWQRGVVVCGLNNGEVVAGELISRQPFAVNKQSIADLDPASQANAIALLGEQEQVTSKQLYLRTGNFDVDNRHFAYIPEVTLRTDAFLNPDDIWLFERKEWGVLYGFPVRYEESFAAEFDAEHASLKLFADQMDRFEYTSDASNADAFKSAISAKLAEHASKQLQAWKASLPSDKNEAYSTDAMVVVSKPSALRDVVEKAMARIAVIDSQLEHAKVELGSLDRLVAADRIGVRQAEIDDKTDLQAISEEIVQIASMRATASAQWDAMSESLKQWLAICANDALLKKQLDSIVEQIAVQRKAEIEPVDASLNDAFVKLADVPANSVNAVKRLAKSAETVAAKQFDINVNIVRLEQISNASSVYTQVPTIDWAGSMPQADVPSGDRWTSFPTALSEKLQWGGSVGGATVRSLSDQRLVVAETDQGSRYAWIAPDSDGSVKVGVLREKPVRIADIVRFTEPNTLGGAGRASLYGTRWIEFLFGQPREAGIEGGFFPALWGTIVMTLIMSVAVMPFGVMAALYMREYAKSGWMLSLVRISINNLAGVPSIVYGVFGLAFFCYTIGGYIDGGPQKAGFDPWPTSTWFIALGGTVLFGLCAFGLATLGSGSPAHMTPLRKRVASFGGLFWIVSLLGVVCLFVKSPFFHGFYEASLPNPTFGKGCLLWASCTLALLTLPVVIVATEEALAAVPNSLREGSYACGAGKWQTLQRIVLPYARPGIITGFILAMARGAGEVAPMMLVGAIPLATDLPLDLEFPFFHGSRSFMHLGFQIYSLGFQSQNSEAAKPMVFTATLLLLTIVTLLNVTAIWLRARLRKRFAGSQF